MKTDIVVRQRPNADLVSHARRSPRVLVVEDDEAVRSDLVLLLSEEGFDCLACRTAEQATNLMAARADIAVALVDIRLPGLSGLDFIDASRNRDGTVLPTRFIVTSGHVDLDSAMQALRLKVDDILPKPIDPDVLLGAVRRSVEEVTRSLLGRGVTAALADEAGRESHAAVVVNRSMQKAADSVLRVISEELRQPLVPIMDGCEQLLLADTPPAHSARIGLAMRNEAVKLLERIDSMVDLARLTSGPVPLRLTVESPIRLAEMVIENFGPPARLRSVRIDLDALDAPATVIIDRGIWLQALAHVVRNAVEHAPKSTVVKLRLSQEADRLVVDVSDRGAGMSEAAAARVLEAFRQGSEGPERRKKGLGLGLTLARGFVEAHGGNLTIRSNEGTPRTGTVVRLSIPQ